MPRLTTCQLLELAIASTVRRSFKMMRHGILFLFIMFSLVHTSVQAALVDKTVAIVNSDIILLSDINKFYKTLSLRREIDPLFSLSEGFESAKPSTEVVLNFLIQERLVSQAFKVQDSEVETEIKNVMKNNNLDEKQLIKFLETKGFDYQDYSDIMRIGLQKRMLLDREIRIRVNISDDDVRNYYYNNAVKTSKAPLEYSLQMIIINGKNYKSSRFATETAQNALTSLRQGEAFGEVAKRVSDDQSAAQSGELGFIADNQLSPAILSAVKKMKIGGISDVIVQNNLYYIVRLVDVRSEENKHYDQEKEKIREALAKVEYKRQLVIWAERARSSAFIKVNQ